MSTALQDPATQDAILQETHAAESAFEKSSQLADERAGKHHPTSAYLSGKVILDHISTSPPAITKDDGDSYAHFKSSVVLTFKTEGQTDSLSVEMPVTADQTGKWNFPDTPEAIKLTKTQFDTPAEALLERSKY